MSFRQTSQEYAGYLSGWGGQASAIFCSCKTRQQFFKTWLYLLLGLLCTEEMRIPQYAPEAGSGMETPLPPWKGREVLQLQQSQISQQSDVSNGSTWHNFGINSAFFLTREHGSICVEMRAVNLGRQLSMQRGKIDLGVCRLAPLHTMEVHARDHEQGHLLGTSWFLF